MPDFLFVTCQIGAEGAVKGELGRRWPEFRFAFSRPGFLTFKLPPGHGLAGDFDLEAGFVRAYGFSLGAVKTEGQQPARERMTGTARRRTSFPTRPTGGDEMENSSYKSGGDELENSSYNEELAAAVWKAGAGRTYQRIHVWERDRFAPGVHGFEPTVTPAAIEAHRLLVEHCPQPQSLAKSAADPLHPARPGEMVLDCVILEPGQWWAGWHRAKSVPSRYPGGLMPLELPPDAVSRAWLKMEEALRWSELPIARGARVAEIGSAPGGASQALLARGLWVTGIDPAEMAPAVLGNSHFTHIRRRSPQVRRRDFRKIRWLTADMNVAPNCTLDAVEAIVTHPEVSIRGLLLTLKLPDWELAGRVPEYVERVRSWGYNVVRARQLQFDRREVCVAGVQTPFRRKPFLTSYC
jgi:23S rRNA (cytidine2498-2'-O)-methyltransferase